MNTMLDIVLAWLSVWLCDSGQVIHFLWAYAGSFLGELAGIDDGEVIVPTS